MKTQLLVMRRVTQALALAGLVSVAGPAGAADVYLCARTVDLAVPGGGTVPMWGFAPDNAAGDCSQPATVPGPAISVPASDSTLNVYLKNTLTTPVSLVINGLPLPAATGARPVWSDNTAGPRASPSQRVRSFVHETAPGTIGVYNFSGVKAGSYLYQSGTHPQIQVQMGLYGPLTRNALEASPPDPAQAYPGVPYADQVTLLYSEVDPALHAQVSGGTYDPLVNSTLNYQPKYFLINGKAFQPGDPALAALTAGQKTLLRFINAGLQTHVPVIDGATLRIVAEDGNPYPWPANPREQYSVLLPAAKTVDAILTPQLTPGGAANRYPLYDRRLGLTNDGTQDGGMLAFLDVTAGGNPPVITSVPVTVATQGVPYSYAVTATDVDGGVLSYSLDPRPAGMSIDSSSGLITWTPGSAQVGPQAATARVTDPTGLFATQAFSIAVADVNDPPVAQNDAYGMIQGGTLNVAASGVLANDSDPDAGNTLTAVNFGAPSPNGILTPNANGGFSFTAATTGAKTFTYQARDNSGAVNNTSASATVTVNVIANRPPTAVDNTFSAPVRRTSPPYTAQILAVLSNDSDPDTPLDPSNVINPATVTITTAPNKGGTLLVNANGTLSYTPKLNFRGTEAFRYRVRDNLNAQSNAATVRVNVQ